MTVQFTDQYIFKNEAYDITALENSLGFDPSDYGAFSISFCPACAKGFYGQYGLREGRLCLRNLYMTTLGHYPEIRGVAPEANRQDFFLSLFKVYRGVNIPAAYSGSMFIGRELVEDFYESTGVQKHYAYKDVYLLKFKDGRLKSARDYSDKMQKIRDDIICDTNYFYYDEASFSFVRNPSYDSPYEVNWEDLIKQE